MPLVSELVVFGTILVLQCVGIASVAVSQFYERYGASTLCQKTFFISLLAMGLATVLAILQGQACWLSGAAMLGVMSVGATFDVRSSRRALER